VLVLLGIFRSFSFPVSRAILPQLVPEEHFSNAVAWNASTFQIATIAGPAIGGVASRWARCSRPKALNDSMKCERRSESVLLVSGCI